MRTVAAYLTQLKDEKDVSYQVIADATGVSAGTLSYIGSGKTLKPRPDILHKIAVYFGGGSAKRAAVIYEEFMDRAGYLDALPQLSNSEILDRLRQQYPEIYRQLLGGDEPGQG